MLGITYGSVHYFFIYEDLQYQKLYASWVPRLLLPQIINKTAGLV